VTVKLILRRYGKRASVMLVLGILLLVFWYSLPDPLFDVPYSSVLLSEQGELLGARIAADGQWRFPASTHVPKKFRQAIIQYEDKRFTSHPGVDPLALARAFRQNIKAGRIVSGGSTLSMQVVRLSRHHPRRTYVEKAIEAVQTLRLELRYSKDQILALYAAHAPFGGNVVGLDTAAWRYFGRAADQLSWAESAMLAVLPNSPSLIHPGRHRQQLKQKRDALLQRLHQAGVLDATALKLAQLEPLPEKPLSLPRVAPHLLDSLAGRYGQSRFHSTLDANLQRKVSQLVQQHSHQLALQGIHNAAAIVIDHHRFDVRAYVGNSRSLPAANAPLQHGYAVDIVRRPRSTGSLLKPFLYATMIEQSQILPSMLVPDLPTQYNGYRPENYDRRYRGAVPAREALARSLNVPAVRMLRQYGVDRFYDFLRNFGMTTLHRRAEDYGLTLILGGAEGTLWDMSSMYANLAAAARQQSTISERYYRQPRVLMQQQTRTRRHSELGPAAAWMTLDALLEVNRPGIENHWRNFSSSRKLAWKTGTSYGLRDGWAIGNSGRYTIGVWVGNASGEGRPGLTGGATAAPLLFDIVNLLDSAPWFEKPLPYMKQVQVCKDDGYLANALCDSEAQWIPRHSHFDKVTPNHRIVHLDQSQQQVHSRCQAVAEMQHKSWFVLPPGQAWYYRQRHINYRSVPNFRRDCMASQASSGKAAPIELLYPVVGSKFYIPVDLAEVKSRVVFEAVHRDADATLYWHLDDRYLGETATFHKLELDIAVGWHRITLVDQQGNRLVRWFEVLGKEDSVQHGAAPFVAATG